MAKEKKLVETNPVVAEYVIPGMVNKVFIHTLIFKTLCLFDPAPPFLDELETTEQYAMRVEKKYALRQLNLKINTLPSLDIKRINEALEKAAEKVDLDYYGFLKRLFVQRTKLILLKQQISK